jgi:8-oxo-dGTP pyrophosphatase MutT (NUDIX family)
MTEPSITPPVTLPPPEKGRIAPRPKLAATIVLLRERGGQTQILMGKRSARHDFMPSVYVFPGGRVDRADSIAPAANHISARTREILEAAMTPARARACVMAAVRETFEETSLVLGEKFERAPKAVNDPSWQDFHKLGYVPTLSDIEVFGRAITPPYRHKRFDTWFFVARLDDQVSNRHVKDSAELLDTNWFGFDEIDELETHRATQMMLAQLKIYLALDHPPRNVFFSRVHKRRFQFSRFPDTKRTL